jgi:hypothetical protein
MVPVVEHGKAWVIHIAVYGLRDVPNPPETVGRKSHTRTKCVLNGIPSASSMKGYGLEDNAL